MVSRPGRAARLAPHELRHLRTPDNHEASETAVADPIQSTVVLLVEDTEPVDTVTAEPVDEQTSTGAPKTIWSANLPGTRHADMVTLLRPALLQLSNDRSGRPWRTRLLSVKPIPHVADHGQV